MKRVGTSLFFGGGGGLKVVESWGRKGGWSCAPRVRGPKRLNSEAEPRSQGSQRRPRSYFRGRMGTKTVPLASILQSSRAG